jgi:ABC-type siderophore export system fused ATPase/permease subunit
MIVEYLFVIPASIMFAGACLGVLVFINHQLDNEKRRVVVPVVLVGCVLCVVVGMASAAVWR